jgi:hypothetical protein
MASSRIAPKRGSTWLRRYDSSLARDDARRWTVVDSHCVAQSASGMRPARGSRQVPARRSTPTWSRWACASRLVTNRRDRSRPSGAR